MKQKKENVGTIVSLERKLIKAKSDFRLSNFKYKNALERIDALEREMSGILKITRRFPVKAINPRKNTINGDGVAVVVMSDWHYEEEVRPENVNGLNEFNIKIANQRIENAWQNSLKLIKHESRDNDIHTVVIALLGDFISSSIHDELMEINQMGAAPAMFAVQKKIVSGIQFLLDNTDKNYVVHCIAGNHPRLTKKIRHATFTENSLEVYMYHNLAIYFESNSRVKFNIPASAVSYLDVLGQKIRLHHGHYVRYQGGIMGIGVPARKAINEWNTSINADLTIIGHWHQLTDGGNYLINGSIIGFSAYALSLKCRFEEPKQLFFLINKHGRTGYTKIVV